MLNQSNDNDDGSEVFLRVALEVKSPKEVIEG